MQKKITTLFKLFFINIPVVAIPLYLGLNLIYLSPPTPMTKTLKVPVNDFMNKYFTQGWELFAPNPGYTTVKLVISCEEDKVFGEWFDPVEKVLKRHYQNRFSTAGLLMKQYKFIATELNNSIINKKRMSCLRGTPEECSSVKKDVENSLQMKEAKRYAKTVCLNKSNMASAYRFKLIEIHPHPYSKRGSKGKYSKVDFILERKGKI